MIKPLLKRSVYIEGKRKVSEDPVSMPGFLQSCLNVKFIKIFTKRCDLMIKPLLKRSVYIEGKRKVSEDPVSMPGFLQSCLNVKFIKIFTKRLALRVLRWYS